MFVPMLRKLLRQRVGTVRLFLSATIYIPDRIRAEVEDELRNQYELDVRILDRTWILDRVFQGKHEAVAIEELNLTTHSMRFKVLYLAISCRGWYKSTV
jgi:hypothetical protein